ncbi:RidA family protein [Vibrio mangrovi]|uniref:Enamine/imine deaminase n=1 Tax=Vibrio mangrovi TaxID=474394 RepID=A0A1Y6IZ24_9VIBR|nr:RidA family protein [Vibrio mangrovi]MDW6005468.1 RidA family protein [Vibrio mangrovi]SMS02090.1 Enamine/imine deaminase [Vibrio mangrovi]
MNLQRKNYASLDEPIGPYVHAVRHENTLYLSGLTAFGTSAQFDPIELQTKAIFEQIRSICQAENTGLENLIKITAFVTDLSRMSELRQALFEVYGEHLPASSLIHVAGLFSPELKIEIEAVVAVA